MDGGNRLRLLDENVRAIVLLSVGTVGFLVLVWAFSAILLLRKKRHQLAVGFFHPFTNDGGGGERVLWCAMRAIQEQMPGLGIVIYTGDPATPENLRDRAFKLFGVQLHFPPEASGIFYCC